MSLFYSGESSSSSMEVSEASQELSTSRMFKTFDDGFIQTKCRQSSFDEFRFSIHLPPLKKKYFYGREYSNCPEVRDLNYTGYEIKDSDRINYLTWIISTRIFANTLSIKEMKSIEIYQGIKYFSLGESEISKLPANAMRTHHLQDFLRNNRKGDYSNGSRQVARYVKLLQGVIERAPKPLEPMVVWRGTQPKNCGVNLETLFSCKMPKQFDSASFYSFSTDFVRAFKFSINNNEETRLTYPTLIKVVLRPEDNAQYLLVSAFNDTEKEVLFQAYTSFTLKNIVLFTEYQKKLLMNRDFDFYADKTDKTKKLIDNTLIFEYEAVFTKSAESGGGGGGGGDDESEDSEEEAGRGGGGGGL